MALQSQVWSPATPMPMAESSLYRQRLEVIALPVLCAQEKRRLQEEISAARRELEEEKLRVERLKRKSLRERWLMDGAAEELEQPQDPASQDPQSPEDQAQARIRNLEGSLFTLQSQLQLLQSASTGAQHKPTGKPTWRRQGHRPLSQPTVEAGPAGGCIEVWGSQEEGPESHSVAPSLLSPSPLTPPGQTDLNKRASIPAGPVGTYPESPSKSRDESVGVPPAPRRIPGAAVASSEANGPCPGSSPPPEQAPSQGVAVSDGGVNEAKGGGTVKVVWEGLRATEDCTTGATGPELEAKVEEMVMEAIGDRQEAGRRELPSWVREDRDIVEVVWEGVGGTEGSDSEAMGEAGRGLEAAQTSSLRLQEGPGGAASGEGEGAPRGSADGDGQGGFGGEEGSFIWVERVTLGEQWEELVVEGLEGPKALGREGKDDSPLGAGGRSGEETWEAERRWAEELAGKRGSEGTAGAEPEGAEMSLAVERKGSEKSLEPERRVEEKVETEMGGGDEPLSAERKEVEGPLRAERERGEEPLGVQQKGGEEKLEAIKEPLVTERKEGEESLMVERIGGEEALEGKEKRDEESLKVQRTGGEQPSEAETKGDEEPLKVQRTGGEQPSEAETKGDEEPLKVQRTGGEQPSEAETKGDEESQKAERMAGEGPLQTEKTQGVEGDLSPEEQRESGGGKECQAEEVSEEVAPLGAKEEPRPEEEGQQPQEKQEGSPEAEAVKPQTSDEGQDPSGDATPLLAETPSQEQPAECQPLLQVEEPRANPSAQAVPTYAPAQQPEPSAPPEGEEASGPKQKTCQCCAVM
ncbi:paralemmin-3 isoform X3 [Phocoena sinus]|uniref:paralemmin-3 isoform X3 n=1 Tax=Phocoena sinus TaxID=42100 RepID=UPI0013C418E4|nr:paralemmin-3 isoform X3 [Phocoena sinus]